MAIVPEYTVEQRPAGPTPYSGPRRMYDESLAVLQGISRELGDEAEQRNQQLRRVKMGVDANTRAVDFTLKLQNIVKTSAELSVTDENGTRLADPSDQEAFFRDQSQQLIDRYVNMPGADEDIQASLYTSMQNEMTSALLNLRKEQHARVTQEIVDESQISLERAQLAGDKALGLESLNNLVRVGAITDAKRDEEVANWDRNVALIQARSAIDSIAVSDLPLREQERQIAYVENYLDNVIQIGTDPEAGPENVLTEDQRKLAMALQGDIAALKNQTNKKMTAQIKENDRQLMAGVLATNEGIAQGEDVVTPSKVIDLMRIGAVSEEAGTAAVDRLNKPRTIRSSPDARAQVLQAITEAQVGATTRDNALKVLYENEARLSDTDFGSFHKQIYSEASSAVAKRKLEGKRIIDDVIYPRMAPFGTQERKEPFITYAQEAWLQLDKEIEESFRNPDIKPMVGRDIEIRAHEIALEYANGAKHAEEQANQVETPFGYGLGTTRELGLEDAIRFLNQANGDINEAKRLANEWQYGMQTEEGKQPEGEIPGLPPMREPAALSDVMREVNRDIWRR